MTAPPKEDTHRQMISFFVGSELFGFEIHFVDKVIEIPAFSFVPRAPIFSRGAVNHRGKVMAVVDLSRFFGLEEKEVDVNNRIIIIDSDVYNLGLLVDRVERIETVPVVGQMVRSPGELSKNPYVSKVVNLGGRVFNLLDVAKLLQEIENYYA
jgi:purine-binding chemotaxis protein CheW